MKKEEIRLIDKLYKDLYLDSDVLKLSQDKYDKFNNIEKYINYLEETHSKAIDHNHINLLKELYYSKYVIKKEDISESYYTHQKEIYLERGYGHIELTKQMKKELQEEVIINQKRSLDTWLDYLLSEDARYPFWAKYWAFQGMLKIGSYNKEKGTFNKRTIDTIDPFIDLNREALALSIDLVIKGLNKENIDDKELEGLVKSGSFAKIYTYILNNTLKNSENIVKRNIGKWVKYDQGSDHMMLVNSLKGYNTGWCTAGEATAKSQLSEGDFYVYYTLDEDDQYKVPRIAIRMEGNSIGEIRGIADNQNIESEMEKVVEEKIQEFPDREKYYKKVNDMKTLTNIYNKHKNKIELTKEELRFLYEIDSEILGFGYDKDPRIDEIINERGNIKEEISLLLGCNPSQIALKESEIKDDTQYYRGDLSLYSTSIVEMKLPKIITGDLYLINLINAEGLKLPQRVGGDLDLRDLTNAKGLVLPESIGRNLYLNGLTSAEGLKLPSNLGRDLYLNDLSNPKGLVLPENINGILNLSGLKTAEGLKLPRNVEGYLDLSRLTSAKGLILPESIGDGLYLNSLISIEGLVLPKKIGSSLYLASLTSVEGLIFPKSISGCLSLTSLISAKGLVLPEIIGSLDLRSLESAEGLEFPEKIGGYLYLGSLRSSKGLKLPKCIEGFLDLRDLIIVDNLVLPETMAGDVYLNRLTSTEGLVIPDPLNYIIRMNDFNITPENVDQYRNKKIK